eukprot:COSAG06_NODE_32828_length_499_cov_1.420000_1_plen_166_part_11
MGTLEMVPTATPTRTRVTLDLQLTQRQARHYTIFQNVEVTLGHDRYRYSECWPMSLKGRPYDVFRVPEERRGELYTARTYTWVEEGGHTPDGYERGTVGDPDTPWGTALGNSQRREVPPHATVTERTTQQWWTDGHLLQNEVRWQIDDWTEPSENDNRLLCWMQTV